MKIICYKSVRFIGVALLATALIGCSTFTQQENTQNNCHTNRLLLVDLTQAHASKAMLPNGEVCPSGAI